MSTYIEKQQKVSCKFGPIIIIIETFALGKIDEDSLMHWNPKKGQYLKVAKL